MSNVHFLVCYSQSSFDDVCYMESVITRIKLEIIPDQEGMFTIPRQHLKKTVRLLREALAAERGEELEGTVLLRGAMPGALNGAKSSNLLS